MVTTVYSSKGSDGVQVVHKTSYHLFKESLWVCVWLGLWRNQPEKAWALIKRVCLLKSVAILWLSQQTVSKFSYINSLWLYHCTIDLNWELQPHCNICTYSSDCIDLNDLWPHRRRSRRQSKHPKLIIATSFVNPSADHEATPTYDVWDEYNGRSDKSSLVINEFTPGN